jgi:beta-lactamase regulating signal transducer with metallopeptidase domain
MNWLSTQIALVDGATGTLEFAVNWLLQSSLLIAVGLVIARLLRQRGSAVQSVVYRTTMAAVLICPLATWGLSQAGVSGWSVQLPPGWSHEPLDVVVAEVDTFGPITASEFAEPIRTRALPAESSPLVRDEMLADGTTPNGRMPFRLDGTQTTEAPSAVVGSSAEESDEPLRAKVAIHPFGMVALGVAAIWLLVSFGLAARLVNAWRQIARLRRRSMPVDADTIRICHEIASALGVSAPDVLRSPCLPSPCLAGIRRPAVLLPEVDQSLSIREVLIHELAHLRRRDCHWNLLRQMATAAFFFQPLLWKLSRLLETTAEEVCDDYVMEFGGDREAYAHRLVDIAELSSTPIAPAGVGIVSLRSMLARRVTRIMDASRPLSTRVGSLLLTLVLAGGLIGTTIVGLVGISPRPSVAEASDSAATDDSGNAITDSSQDDDVIKQGSQLEHAAAPSRPTEDVTAAGVTAANQDKLSREYKGKVVDPTGKPVEAAELYLVFHIPQPTGLLAPIWRPVATTDAGGEFRFKVSPKDFGIYSTAYEFSYGALCAVKDGFGFAWSQAAKYETTGDLLRDARARLKEAPVEFLEQIKRMLSGSDEPLKLVLDDQPIRGRIVDINGQPVAGARLTLLEVWGALGDDLAAWRKAAQEPKADYYSARMKTPMGINGPQVRSLLKPAVTDASGRFTLRGVGRGRIAELLVEGPGIESTKIFARTEKGEKIELVRERRSPDLGSYVYHPAELTLIAGPSTAITGVVRDAMTQAALAGVTVKSQSRHGEPISGWGQDFVRAVTDEQGRYRLEGMPIGSDNRIAAIAPPGDIPYLSTSKRAATTSQSGPIEIDFELPRAVWIEGRITDKQTAKGLAGRLAYYVKQGNPSYGIARSLYVDERDRLQSDDEGYFRIAALPGPGFITFMAHDHQNYPRAEAIVKPDGTREKVARSMLETAPSILMPQNYHLVAEVDPAENAKRVELNLELDPGKSLFGRVVDPENNPVMGYYYAGQMAQFTDIWRPSAGDKFELRGYDPESPRHVYFAHSERNLAGHVVVAGEPPEDLVVKLQPAGAVKGRLVDDDGVPLGNCQLVPWHPPMISPADLDDDYHAPPLPRNSPHRQSGEYETDDEGRFEISYLVPGVEYRLRAFDRASMTPGRGRMPKFSGPLAVVINVAPGESKDLGDVRLADEAEFSAAVRRAKSELPR